jgi:hypothetical protein
VIKHNFDQLKFDQVIVSLLQNVPNVHGRKNEQRNGEKYVRYVNKDTNAYHDFKKFTISILKILV